MPDYLVSRYVVHAFTAQGVTGWSTRTGRVLDFSLDEWDRLCDDPSSLEPLIANKLVEAGFLVLDSAERESILEENDAAVLEDPAIDLVIAPSSNCTLGCNLPSAGGYCGQVHKKGSVSESTLDDVAAFVLRSRRPHHTTLRVSWFGGEPLLAFQELRYGAHALIQAARSSGLLYQSDIVTGGTLLTKAVASECYVELGVREINVTLDGPSKIHDLRRCTKSGKATFDRIIENLSAVIADASLEGLALTIRCNVDKRNAGSVCTLIRFLATLGWQKRVQVYFANVHPWGANDARVYGLSGEEFAALEIGWAQELAERGFTWTLLPRRKPIVCRVVSSARLVVSPSGDLHRCTETPLTPVNLLRDTAGSVGDFKSAQDVPRWKWNDKLRTGRHPCSTCSFLPTCGGTCPLSWETGSDVPCPPYKFNFRELLQLQRSSCEQIIKFATDDIGSLHSIFGLMKQAASLKDLESVETLFTELTRMREISNFGLFRAAAAAEKLVGGVVLHFEDYRLRKLEEAARYSSAAYLYYKAADLEGLMACTTGAVEKLHLATQDSTFDGRFAQVQVLLNYLSARLRMTGLLDAALGEQLNLFLGGRRSIRIGSAHLRSIESYWIGVSPLPELGDSLRQLIGNSGANACLST